MALTDNLQAYWKLDESSGDAADSSGNGLTATNVNTVAFSAGKINNGADFVAASTEYFSVGDPAALRFIHTSAFSLSFWIKSDADQFAYYFGRIDSAVNGSGYGFNRSTNDNTTAKVRFSILSTAGAGLGLESAATIFDATWHFVVGTYDGSTNGTGMKIYIDGSLNATGTGTGNIVATIGNAGDTFIIGAREAGNQPFTGSMDECGVWSRELTAAEVTTLYNAGAGLAYPFSVATARKNLTLLGVG